MQSLYIWACVRATARARVKPLSKRSGSEVMLLLGVHLPSAVAATDAVLYQVIELQPWTFRLLADYTNKLAVLDYDA